MPDEEKALKKAMNKIARVTGDVGGAAHNPAGEEEEDEDGDLPAAPGESSAGGDFKSVVDAIVAKEMQRADKERKQQRAFVLTCRFDFPDTDKAVKLVGKTIDTAIAKPPIGATPAPNPAGAPNATEAAAATVPRGSSPGSSPPAAASPGLVAASDAAAASSGAAAGRAGLQLQLSEGMQKSSIKLVQLVSLNLTMEQKPYGGVDILCWCSE